MPYVLVSTQIRLVSVYTYTSLIAYTLEFSVHSLGPLGPAFISLFENQLETI